MRLEPLLLAPATDIHVRRRHFLDVVTAGAQITGGAAH